jgi:hypothetical protein
METNFKYIYTTKKSQTFFPRLVYFFREQSVHAPGELIHTRFFNIPIYTGWSRYNLPKKFWAIKDR